MHTGSADINYPVHATNFGKGMGTATVLEYLLHTCTCTLQKRSPSGGRKRQVHIKHYNTTMPLTYMYM